MQAKLLLLRYLHPLPRREERAVDETAGRNPYFRVMLWGGEVERGCDRFVYFDVDWIAYGRKSNRDTNSGQIRVNMGMVSFARHLTSCRHSNELELRPGLDWRSYYYQEPVRKHVHTTNLGS